ncbi:hypothetical protein VP01_6666g1, partial [Puccinia sorghi]
DQDIRQRKLNMDRKTEGRRNQANKKSYWNSLHPNTLGTIKLVSAHLSFLEIESDGNCSFQVVSYCLGRWQNDHISVWNKLYQDTKERSQLYIKAPMKERNGRRIILIDIYGIYSFIKRIKFESSGPCHVGNWMPIPTAEDLIANIFKSP